MLSEEFDVIIIGGGPSGLAAAHELAEKKLKVCVVDASPYIGGKPISALKYPWMPPAEAATSEQLKDFFKAAPQENTSVKNTLPLEHGFRVYPQNYCNLMDLMKRIPTGEGTHVNDLLTVNLQLANYVEKIPVNTSLIHKIKAKLEAFYFALAIYTPYLLSTKRALKYDNISITQLFNLKNRSPEFSDLILRLTDSLCSGALSAASSLAVVNILMNYFYAPNRTGFRTFDRPTHIAWLEPWQRYLESLQVQFITQTKLVAMEFTEPQKTDCSDVTVKELICKHQGETKRFQARFYILALPVDAVTDLIKNNYEMLRYDYRLMNLFKITTLPATGVQLYYEEGFTGLENKIIAGSMAKHPWGISYVEQSSYWTNASNYCGEYGVISIYTSITNQAGKYIKKPMVKCSANEIAYEMFQEIETDLQLRGIKIPKRVGFSAHSYQKHTTYNTSEEPINYHLLGALKEDQLHLCTVGMWPWRPTSETIYLGNVVLCGAYTKNNNFYVSTMESAAESGRRAANTILNQFDKPPVALLDVPLPKLVSLSRTIDRVLYSLFLPNPLDLLFRLFRRTLNSSDVHMDPIIQKHENLHW